MHFRPGSNWPPKHRGKMHFVTLIALAVAVDLQRKFLTSDALSTLRHLWPRGLYGLPMAITGCPKSRDFEWQIGYRFQDLEDNTKQTSRSAVFHLAAHIVNGDVDQLYCIKDTVVKDKDLPLWPKGKYCIYQRGTKCPETDGKFQAGFVLWDDENGSENHKNLNKKSGVLPAGKFDNDTLIRFCCQVNGSQTNPINLPVEDPFYLIFYEKNKCQEVFGTFHIRKTFAMILRKQTITMQLGSRIQHEPLKSYLI